MIWERAWLVEDWVTCFNRTVWTLTGNAGCMYFAMMPLSATQWNEYKSKHMRSIEILTKFFHMGCFASIQIIWSEAIQRYQNDSRSEIVWAIVIQLLCSSFVVLWICWKSHHGNLEHDKEQANGQSNAYKSQCWIILQKVEKVSSLWHRQKRG